MDPTVSVLIKYFKKELPKLQRSYKWKISGINGFGKNGQADYFANVDLKRFFNHQWLSASDDKKVELAKCIVSDWGGVRNNRLSTIESYVKEIGKEIPKTPISGVASYSKIFSITDLDKYAIYDARVAACLNAVQYAAGIKEALAFNYVPGRNKTTGHAGEKTGFSQDPTFKVRNLVAKGWKRIKRDETYSVYLGILKECLKAFPKNRLYELEMVLFANAESECRSAMRVCSV